MAKAKSGLFSYEEEESVEDGATPTGSIFTTEDPDRLHVVFDKETTIDINRLASEMGGPKPEEVVGAALEILALALNYNLEVESKYRRGNKRVRNLWAR
jgi:hypothetical protein